jgi:hypothetical protein
MTGTAVRHDKVPKHFNLLRKNHKKNHFDTVYENGVTTELSHLNS